MGVADSEDYSAQQRNCNWSDDSEAGDERGRLKMRELAPHAHDHEHEAPAAEGWRG